MLDVFRGHEMFRGFCSSGLRHENEHAWRTKSSAHPQTNKEIAHPIMFIACASPFWLALRSLLLALWMRMRNVTRGLPPRYSF